MFWDSFVNRIITDFIVSKRVSAALVMGLPLICIIGLSFVLMRLETMLLRSLLIHIYIAVNLGHCAVLKYPSVFSELYC